MKTNDKTPTKEKTFFKNYDLYSDANPKDTIKENTCYNTGAALTAITHKAPAPSALQTESSKIIATENSSKRPQSKDL